MLRSLHRAVQQLGHECASHKLPQGDLTWIALNCINEVTVRCKAAAVTERHHIPILIYFPRFNNDSGHEPLERRPSAEDHNRSAVKFGGDIVWPWHVSTSA
jgi:hypothetical protein